MFATCLRRLGVLSVLLVVGLLHADAAATTPARASGAAGRSQITAPPNFVTAWGSSGTGPGQFAHPSAIATDNLGHVFVLDSGNERVEEFTSTGAFITQWGSQGTGPGQFSIPVGIAVDTQGHVFVVDNGLSTVEEFTSSGQFVTYVGAAGTWPGQFMHPTGVAVDGTAFLFVADPMDNRIEEFDLTSGNYILSLGPSSVALNEPPRSVGLASGGLGVYAVNYDPDRVDVFDATGYPNGGLLTEWGSPGSGAAQFAGPAGIAVDSASHVYVADSGNQRIEAFDGSGGYLTQWGTNGTGPGQFENPVGVAVDAQGAIYVVDVATARVEKFAFFPAVSAVSAVSPASGPTTGGTAVTIAGEFFTGATAVHFGTTAAQFTLVSDTQITATAPAAAAGTVDITVTNAAGTSLPSAADQFTYVTPPLPVVSAVSPASGAASGGTLVAITGSGFDATLGGTRVSFGGLPARLVATTHVHGRLVLSSRGGNTATVCAPAVCYAQSPPGAAGSTVAVTVTTSGGSSAMSAADRFTYTPACGPTTLAATPASPQPAGAMVTLTATERGCPQGATYEFWLLPPGGAWQVVQPFAPSPTFPWSTSGLGAGSYQLAVWVQAAGSANPYDSYALTPFTLTAFMPCTGATLTASPATSQVAGEAVTLNATAAGCADPTFAFWEQMQGGSWSLLGSGYAGSSSVTWPTSGLGAGTYTLAVWARAAGSSAAYEAYAILPGYTLSAPCTSVTLALAPSGQTLPGQTVQATAAPAGGSGGCAVEFWLDLPSAGWTVVQPYSSATNWSWETGGLAPGSYLVAVWAKAAGSANEYDSYAVVPFTLAGCSSVALSASPSSPQVVGTAVTLTATVMGCASADVEWWVLPPGGQWAVVAPYPGQSTLTLDTTGLAPGAWYLAVWVRQTGSSSPGDAAGVLGYTLTAPGSAAAGSAARTSEPVPEPPRPDQASGANPGVRLPRVLPRGAVTVTTR